MTNPDDVLKRFDEMRAQWESDEPTGYKYDNAEPGMQDAVERAREGSKEMDGLDLSVGGADSPEGQLKAAFDKAGKEPEQAPEGVTAPEDVGPPPPAPPPEEPWANLAHRLNQAETAAPSTDPLLEKMRSVGWAPKPKTTPDWAKLQADLQAAEHAKDSLRNVGAMLSGAGTGKTFEAPANAGEGDVAAAKAALEVPKEQQATEHAQQEAERAQLQHEAATKAAAKASEADDPKSEESARARAAIQAEFGDTGKLPPDIAHYSANDIAKLTPTIGSIAGHQSAEHIAKGREDAAAAEKAKAAAEKTAAADAAKVADVESLGAAKQLWLKTSPYAKDHALTPDDLRDIKSRKDWEDFLNQTKPSGKAAKGTGGPAKAVKGLPDIADPNDRARVQLLLENTSAPEEFGRKDGPRLIGLAKQIDPSYDPHKARLGKEVRDQIAKDHSIDSINTAIDHIDEARRLVPETFDSQFVNRLKNAIVTGAGSAELTKFQDTLRVAAAEYSKALGENAQGGKEEIAHLLDPVQSKEQMNAALDQIDRLLSGRIHAIAQRYKTYTNAELPGTLKGREEAPKPGEQKKNPDELVLLQSKDGKKRKTLKRSQAEAVLAAPGGDAYEVK